MILPSEVRMKCSIRPEGGSEALRAGLSHMQQLLDQKRQHKKDNLDNVRIEAEKMPYLERCATISAIEDLKQRAYSENTNDLLPKIQKSTRTKTTSDKALKEVNLSLPKLQQFYSQSMTELGTGYEDYVYKERMGGKMLGSLRFERLKTFVPKSPEPESPLKDRGTLIETQVSNKKSSKMYRSTENIKNISTKQPSKVDKSRDRLHIVGNKDSPLVRYKLPTYRDNDVLCFKRPRLVRNKTNTNILCQLNVCFESPADMQGISNQICSVKSYPYHHLSNQWFSMQH